MPGPVVLDRDVHGAVLLRELERDPTAVGRRLERVREQVPDDLQHAVAVGLDHRARAHLAAKVDRAALRLLAVALVRLGDELAHVDLLLHHREPVGVELREVEDVADEALEPLRLPLHRLERLLLAAPHPGRRLREAQRHGPGSP